MSDQTSELGLVVSESVINLLNSGISNHFYPWGVVPERFNLKKRLTYRFHANYSSIRNNSYEKDYDYLGKMLKNDILKERQMFTEFLENSENKLDQVILEDEDTFAFAANFDVSLRNMLELAYALYIEGKNKKCLEALVDLENLLDRKKEAEYVLNQLRDLKKRVSVKLLGKTAVSTFKPLFKS